jgi:hypothetical protein
MNSLIQLELYQYHQSWVFDDDKFGLVREPFVAGMDKMLDYVAGEMPDYDTGNLLVTASNDKFPGHQLKLEWERGEHGGNWYQEKTLNMEGWLCPALYHYFDPAPTNLYVKVIPKSPSANTRNSKIKDAITELEGMRTDIIQHLLPSLDRKRSWLDSTKAMTRGLYLRRVEALELAIKTLRGVMNDKA